MPTGTASTNSDSPTARPHWLPLIGSASTSLDRFAISATNNRLKRNGYAWYNDASSKGNPQTAKTSRTSGTSGTTSGTTCHQHQPVKISPIPALLLWFGVCWYLFYNTQFHEKKWKSIISRKNDSQYSQHANILLKRLKILLAGTPANTSQIITKIRHKTRYCQK